MLQKRTTKTQKMQFRSIAHFLILHRKMIVIWKTKILIKFEKIFLKILVCQITIIFRCKMWKCAIDQDCIFWVFVALFWSIWWKKWCLPFRYFKRKTYYLQNAVFGSLFVTQEIIKQKASKIWFFFNYHFLNLEFFSFFISKSKMGEQ